MRWPVWCTFVVMILLANRLNAEPAESVAEQPWAKTVANFAKALSDSDPAALVPVLAESVQIEAFDAKGGDAVHLLARARKGLLITNHAYNAIPATMAGDIADALAKAEVPDTVKKDLTPPDPAALKRANEVAAQWIAASLQAKPADSVGLVLFWCVHANDKDNASTPDAKPGELVFVLVKADSGATPKPRIRAIAFGNPARRAN